MTHLIDRYHTMQNTCGPRLAEIDRGAHELADDQRNADFLHAYMPAVHRYLLAAVQDLEVAHDLAQEFAVRVLRGDLIGLDGECGTAGNYLRRCLSNLVTDHFRQQQRNHQLLEAAREHECRTARQRRRGRNPKQTSEVLSRTWQAMRCPKWQDYHAVLKLRVEHPECSSSDLARLLSKVLGRPVEASCVRQMLCRARRLFRELLREQIRDGLADRTDRHLNEELANLGLLHYCRA